MLASPSRRQMINVGRNDMKQTRLIIALVFLCAGFGCVAVKPDSGLIPATQDCHNRQDALEVQLSAIDKAIIRWAEAYLPIYEAEMSARPHQGLEQHYLTQLVGRRKQIQQELEAMKKHKNSSANNPAHATGVPAPDR